METLVRFVRKLCGNYAKSHDPARRRPVRNARSRHESAPKCRWASNRTTATPADLLCNEGSRSERVPPHATPAFAGLADFANHSNARSTTRLGSTASLRIRPDCQSCTCRTIVTRRHEDGQPRRETAGCHGRPGEPFALGVTDTDSPTKASRRRIGSRRTRSPGSRWSRPVERTQHCTGREWAPLHSAL